jgi:salicylate hydroxylase
MMPDRVVFAGAGIGGLTAALALARQGIAVALFDQAQKLEEVGAGVQLGPNAIRVLTELGLADRLKSAVVAPSAIRVRSGRSGRDIATMPLGATSIDRFGAPHWLIHRADLQRVQLAAVADEPLITLTLGAKVDDFTIEPAGVRAIFADGRSGADCVGSALIGADGLWSRLRARLGDAAAPRFAARTAFRALVPVADVGPSERDSVVNLWIGPHGHVVYYPIRGGTAVNIVAVTSNRWRSPAWSTAASHEEVLDGFPEANWAAPLRQLLSAPRRWQKWALYDRPPLRTWGRGAVTLLGDAAHPMLPYLAQGAGMAIEDAVVLARELARSPDDRPAALRRYESARAPRTARVQHAARRNDVIYHLGEPAAFVRNTAMRVLGGGRLLARLDWIYDWRP